MIHFKIISAYTYFINWWAKCLFSFSQTGASIPPETMMHFPPVSDSPLFSKKFRTLRKIFKTLPFFLVDAQISNFPLFSLFQYISPLFRENYYFPPYFDKCPPPLFYTNSPAFYILYVYFVSPYFYHDAFMHHPMQVAYWTPLLSRLVSSLWVSRTGSASDWCALQETLYKCIDTIQYNI